MLRPSAALTMLACACALAIPAAAVAQDSPAEIPDIAVSEPQAVTTGPSYGIARASSTPELWATVNICDTKAAPDAMGVRASMPGNGTRQKMYMRFTAQYWSRALQDWAPVAGSGTSPWVFAGSAEYARRQAGWTFEFAAPPAGITFTMRANVEYQWRAPEQPEKRALQDGKRGDGKRGDGKRDSKGGERKGGKRDSKGGKRDGKRRKAGKRRYRHFDLKSGASRVVRTVTRTTETGIDGVHGGDPAGTSKAMCLIY